MRHSNIDIQEEAEELRLAIHYLGLAREYVSMHVAGEISAIIRQVDRKAQELESEAGCVYDGEGRVV